MEEMKTAYLLVDGDYAIGCIFDDRELAEDIADAYDWQVEDIQFVDEAS